VDAFAAGHHTVVPWSMEGEVKKNRPVVDIDIISLFVSRQLFRAPT